MAVGRSRDGASRFWRSGRVGAGAGIGVRGARADVLGKHADGGATARADAQLAVQTLQVRVDSVNGDGQLPGHRRLGVIVEDALKDIQLTRRQPQSAGDRRPFGWGQHLPAPDLKSVASRGSGYGTDLLLSFSQWALAILRQNVLRIELAVIFQTRLASAGVRTGVVNAVWRPSDMEVTLLARGLPSPRAVHPRV